MKGTRLYNDRFRLEEEIRSGGFATVWRATEVGHDVPLALKIGRVTDDPDLNRSIIKEAELIQRLQHASIVRLFLLPRDDRAPVAYARAIELPGHPFFFAMEYLSGGTLGDMMKEFKKLSLPEAAAIALSVARALDHMHQKNYAHNDLKLENIVFRYPVVAGQDVYKRQGYQRRQGQHDQQDQAEFTHGVPLFFSLHGVMMNFHNVASIAQREREASRKE